MKAKFTLRALLISISSAGVISLIIFLFIPGDPKNAWFLGLSKSRLVMVTSFIIFVGFVLFWVVRILRHESRFEQIQQWVESVFWWDGHLTTGLVFCLTSSIGGIYFLFVMLTTTNQFTSGYFIRLAPWILWFTLSCLGTFLFLILKDGEATQKYLHKNGFAVLAMLVVLTFGLITHLKLGNMDPAELEIYAENDQVDFSVKEQDIYLVFLEGQKLQGGENPYARAADIDEIRWNEKLPTYLPIIYYGSWLTHLAGLQDLEIWLNFWKGIFLYFNLCIGYFVFYISNHRFNSPVFGILALMLWLFNRWTLHVTMISHFNFIPIFLFLVSLSLFPKNKYWSYILFGLSIAIKHNAIFLLPIYLIWAWKSAHHQKFKHLLVALFSISSIPFLASLPFLILNFEGFIKSLLISLSRYPETHIGVLSFDALFGWIGIQGKIPLIALIMITYLLAWRKNLGYFATGLLVMTIFIDFHSVLFRHYMAWMVPLTLLTIGETIKFRQYNLNEI